MLFIVLPLESFTFVPIPYNPISTSVKGLKQQTQFSHCVNSDTARLMSDQDVALGVNVATICIMLTLDYNFLSTLEYVLGM